MTENEVRNGIIEFLQYTGWLVLRVNSGAFAGEYTDKKGRTKKRFMWFTKWFALGLDEQRKGVFDIIAVRPDHRPLAIDAKRPGAESNISPEQRLFMNEWQAHGGKAVIASSLDDVLAAVGEMMTDG